MRCLFCVWVIGRRRVPWPPLVMRAFKLPPDLSVFARDAFAHLAALPDLLRVERPGRRLLELRTRVLEILDLPGDGRRLAIGLDLDRAAADGSPRLDRIP